MVYKIYCDESRVTNSEYILVGGIWILKEMGWGFVNDFENFCQEELGFSKPLGHMKWTKVPPSADNKYYEAYKKLVDLYFEYNAKNIMFFRTLIVNSNDYDFTHKKYYKGDYEEGFYNLYCQLILNWIEKSNKYYIRTAKRNIKKAFSKDSEEIRLFKLKHKINEKFNYRMNRNENPVISIESRVESRVAETRRLIQIADILMGAVGFHWNKEHLKNNAKKGKIELAKYIALNLNRSDLLFETDWRDKKFNIFYFDISKCK